MQVMSQSVSQALYLTAGSQAFETAYFISKIDNFFDCLNVINYTKGIHNRKPFQKPYFKADDSRLQVPCFKCITNSLRVHIMCKNST